MTNKATKYGLMTIAAVLLVALAFAGAASAVIYINDADDWQSYLAGKVVTEDVVICNNINLSSVINPMITSLDGNFDGGGFTIAGFVIENKTGENVGLIGTYYGGYITNVKLSDFYVVGNKNVGGMVGYSSNVETHVENVHAEYGNVTGDNEIGNGQNVGGLYGYSYNGKLWMNESSVNRLYVYSPYKQVGGLVSNSNGEVYIKDSIVNLCEISTVNGSVGGVMGYASSKKADYFMNVSVIDCKIWSSGLNCSGGLVGFTKNANKQFNDCRVENCTLYSSNRVGGLLGTAGGVYSYSGNWVKYSWLGGSTNVGSIVGYNESSNSVTGDSIYSMVYNETGSTLNENWYLSENAFNSTKSLDDAFSDNVGSRVGKTLFAGKDYGYGSAPKHVTYDANGATSGSVPAKQAYAPGSTATVAGQGDLAKIGYDFGGWTVGSTAGEVINPGDTFTITEDVTLYANWVNGPVLLTGTSAMNTYNVLVVDEVTGAVSKKHPSELNDNGAKDVYLIESADHWNAVAIDDSFNGAVLILGDNLDFSGLSNMMTYKFTGKIYGNGYLFDGFTNTTSTTDNVGLIREAGNGLSANYVQMSNFSLNAVSPSKHIGALIGNVTSGSSVNVIGCYVYNGSLISQTQGMGGIVGYVEGNDIRLTLNHSKVLNTTFDGGDYSDCVGGLIGMVSGNSTTIINLLGNEVVDCWIYTLYSGGACPAGLIGCSQGSSTSAVFINACDCNVTGCTIEGVGYNVGGLAAYLIRTNGSFKNCNVLNCNITGKMCLGGLIGQVQFAESHIDLSDCKVIDCCINGTGTSDKGKVGGLIGRDRDLAVVNVMGCDVLRCNIDSTDPTTTGGLFGAITGSGGSATFTNCNAGNNEITALNVTSGNPLNGTDISVGIPVFIDCSYETLATNAWPLTFPTKEEIQVFPASKLPYVYVTYNAAPGVAGSPYSSAKQTVDMPYKRNTAFGSIESGNSVSPVRSGFTLKGWNNAPATVTQNTEVYAIWSENSQQYTPSSSKQTGSTVILQEGQVAPTAYATSTPTVAPTVKPTEQPATPTVIATAKPTTQATQQSPAPVFGILAGLGAAAAALARLRR